MTDVTVSAEAVEEAEPAGLDPVVLDDQLIGRLATGSDPGIWTPETLGS
ncbi:MULTISPECIES: hypothetical protein [unclassified Kitasatospora]